MLEGGKTSKVVKLLGRAVEMLVQEEKRQGLRSLILGLVVGLGQNLRKGKPAQQHLIRGLVLQWVPLCLGLAVPLLLKTMEKAQERWAIFYKGKIIPIGDTTINMIKRDPTEVMGWFEWELMQAWRNLFPLTDLSRRTGFLPIMDKAWSLTPNPWWRFLMDRPVPPTNTSTQSGQTSSLYLSEKSLTELEVPDVETVITERKVLRNTSVECAVMGHIYRVKLIQCSMPVIRGTVLVRTNLAELGILNHVVTIFPKEVRSRQVLIERWRWRVTGHHSAVDLLDRSSFTLPTVNIVVWNCRGALKLKFKQTVADLINWHKPVVMIITETRVSGFRVEEVI